MGDENLASSTQATLDLHAHNDRSYIWQQADRAGADITLLVVPPWIEGNGLGLRPLRTQLLSVRNHRSQLEWVMGVIKSDTLGSYAPLRVLGMLFGLPNNEEVPLPDRPYHAHSFAPWCALDRMRPWLKCQQCPQLSQHWTCAH